MHDVGGSQLLWQPAPAATMVAAARPGPCRLMAQRAAVPSRRSALPSCVSPFLGSGRQGDDR
eukprot:CAMPEP_0197927464 /NCGR_PEP_ID=MMETSP1439-20131203/100761_1 /TAXON_ID=66791 /ORGANISM="Gonyaulax spinifera, Strain CCMP409" /LENGTH=61 /DNA_ID=CAMNT_0043550035 /DNA_START=38 /DNA_END=219 /DNA_ORIENTATION=+